jgi:N-acetyl-1-D-myo-inositol-2-amino-2-deoxy-alpha-D-glucopyranoside deacetylase
MRRQKTLIFFGAHPDDESFGMGSTLAQYTAEGVKVYYVCSTRGEMGTVDSELLKGYASIAERRTEELKCAAEALGLAGVVHLNYRDSGMRGDPANKHPDCLAMAPIEDVTAKMVKVIRELKPDVVVTHSAGGGGYDHPDHNATHNAAVAAFYAAGDAKQYPVAGSAFQPSKLYFGVRPRGMTRLTIMLMRLYGQDPHRAGRNRDIDFTRRANVELPVHAVVHLKKQSILTRNKAAACHSSQGGGIPRRGPFRLIRIIERIRGRADRDFFMRDYPPPTKKREKDLFEGIF